MDMAPSQGSTQNGDTEPTSDAPPRDPMVTELEHEILRDLAAQRAGLARVELRVNAIDVKVDGAEERAKHRHDQVLGAVTTLSDQLLAHNQEHSAERTHNATRDSLHDTTDASQNAQLEQLQADKVRLEEQVAAAHAKANASDAKAERAIVKAAQARRWAIAGKTGGILGGLGTGLYALLKAAAELAGTDGVLSLLSRIFGGHQ